MPLGANQNLRQEDDEQRDEEKEEADVVEATAKFEGALSEYCTELDRWWNVLSSGAKSEDPRIVREYIQTIEQNEMASLLSSCPGYDIDTFGSLPNDNDDNHNLQSHCQ